MGKWLTQSIQFGVANGLRSLSLRALATRSEANSTHGGQKQENLFPQLETEFKRWLGLAG
jgi:hypothetical protein